MAFTGNYSCNSFRTQLMTGFFSSGVSVASFKIALYTHTATLTADTTSYTSTGETSGGNYAAGGQVLAISQVPTVGNSGNTAYISFTNAAWTGAITARGALIYLANGTTNPAVCVLDFGSDKTSTNTFTVQFPAVTNTSAIIRLS